MTKEGSYRLPSGKPHVVFRRGDVFQRTGTSVERITHAGWVEALASFRARVRAEAAADTQEVIARVAGMLREDGAVRGTTPPAVIDLGMGAQDFEDAVDAALTAGNLTAIRRALRPARAVLATAWSDHPSEEVPATLDRVTSVAAVALIHRNLEAYELALDSLYRIYREGLASETNTHARYSRQREVGVFWREIVARVLALLALAVREQAWSFVRPTVLRPIGGDYSYRSWLRHGLTEAARAGVLVSQGMGEPARGAVIRFARQAVAGVPSLHDDVPAELVEQGFDDSPAEQDMLLDSLCQADYLWCLIAVAATGGADYDTKEFYPSCSAFFDHRVLPLAMLLVREDQVRQDVIGQPDPVVAASMVIVDRAASSQAGWKPWSVVEGVVQRFVTANTSPGTGLSS